MAKKRSWKLWLASSAVMAYFSGGIGYTLFGSAVSEKETRGFYNKTVEETELKSDFSLLEKKLKENKREDCKTNVSLSVIVNEDVKKFFDDANNPNDDTAWIEKVKGSLEGLKIYEKEGFNFTVDNVVRMQYDFSGFRRGSEQEGVLLCDLAQAMRETTNELRSKGIKSSYILYFLPAYGGMIGGFADSHFRHEVTFLSHSESNNRSVLAHEVGHLFLLKHVQFDILKEFIDPFFVFIDRNLMNPMIKRQLGGSYVLSGEQKEHLKKIRRLSEAIRIELR